MKIKHALLMLASPLLLLASCHGDGIRSERAAFLNAHDAYLCCFGGDPKVFDELKYKGSTTNVADIDLSHEYTMVVIDGRKNTDFLKNKTLYKLYSLFSKKTYVWIAFAFFYDLSFLKRTDFWDDRPIATSTGLDVWFTRKRKGIVSTTSSIVDSKDSSDIYYHDVVANFYESAVKIALRTM